jgi:hypothetical protein
LPTFTAIATTYNAMKLTKRQLKQIIKEEIKEMMQQGKPAEFLPAQKKRFDARTKNRLYHWYMHMVRDRGFKAVDFDVEHGIPDPTSDDDNNYWSALQRAKKYYENKEMDDMAWEKIANPLTVDRLELPAGVERLK